MPARDEKTTARPAAAPRAPRTHFTLRQRLTVSLMSVGLASLCVAGLVYVTCDLIALRYQLSQHCLEVADRVAHRWQTGIDFASADWQQGLTEDGSVRSVRVLDPAGGLLGVAGAQNPYSGPFHDIVHPSAEQEVFRAGQTLGSVVVEASSATVQARLRTHGSLFLALVGVSALLTLGLARRIHHRFSDQLLDLAHAANAISTRKDYSIRAVRRSEDEIGMLVDTFNLMIAQIEMRDQQLKAEVKRAEAARVAKAQFLATMSHEIRTPINGVLGMTQLLLDTELSAEQKDFGSTIHRSAEGLLSIINDILDFSKGEAGRYEIESIPFEPSRVVHECLDTVSIVAAEKKLELCLELDERLPGTLVGDPSRVRQVLLNLLSNALKFTTKGEIVLRIQVEELQPEKARMRFEVQDTGIGIPKDRIDRLFQSFSQVDASRSRKYGGTGLGLAISKQIVEAMGGSMFVKTEEGRGSIFGFRLQLPVTAGASEPEQHVPSPRSLRVLVADPSPTSGTGVARLLQDGNYVETTTDGASARMLLLESANALQPFDLLMVDLRLIDAFEALDDAGAKQLETTPMVVLAPVNQLSSAAAAHWTGRKAALAKPVKRHDLFWCIHEVLRGPIPSQVAPAQTAEVASPLEGLAVLVAEDHPVNQRITSRFLEKLGITCEVVANGEEAIDALKRRDFDLVLMDVQMPVMDGLEATLAIRKLELLRGTHVPIVALTANVLEEHRKEAQAAGFDDYLAKPVKLEDLRAKIQKWVPARAPAA